jgi:hypothetical protein
VGGRAEHLCLEVVGQAAKRQALRLIFAELIFYKKMPFILPVFASFSCWLLVVGCWAFRQ